MVLPPPTFSWSKKHVQTLRFDTFNFTESSKINIVVDSNNPVAYFRIYFNQYICQLIVDQSILYGSQNNTRLDLSRKDLMLSGRSNNSGF